ncbi:hypothetical protein TWF679_005666 [Orbilia oligospora]|uniref:NACHT domain-containing protein n=1 Tax=Orbilia oligospora TaxID=2813651 RepID=A0A8H8VBK4_ORBOL|nr:hypothetical protein TWF679_005666 [Orbilia oligospora]
MEVVGGVSSVITLVEVAGKIGLLCARYINEVRSAKVEAERLQTEAKVLEGLFTKVDDLLKGSSGAKLEVSRGLKDVLKNSKNILEDIQKKLERGQKSKTARFLSKLPESLNVESLTWPFKKSNINKVFDNLETLKKDITLALVVDGAALDAARDQSKNIDKLGDASVKEAMFGSAQDQEEPQCLPQTRIEVLNTIETWISGPRDSNIFWLRGIAGTGKSTIARTIALKLESTSQLGASFFFKKSEAGRNNASKFFPTLAYGLVKYLPELLPHISKAIEDDFDTLKRSFKEQFEKFLLEPLSKVTCNPTVAIVIDALDECENEREIPLILGPLARLGELKSIDIRVFITSRPDHAPSTGFEELSHQKIQYHDLVLHDVALETVRHDIRIFLTHEFARIRDRCSKKSNKITDDWPGSTVIEQLVNISEPWFISAATICRFIDDNNERHFSPTQRLNIILTSGCRESEVYKIYITIFEQIHRDLDGLSIQDRKTITEERRKIISTIVTLESPLSRNSLSDLINMKDETIYYRLQAFRSILKVPANPDGLVQTFHLSFRDFLLDENLKERAENSTLRGHISVDEVATHQSLAKDCIRLLSQNLRRNICSLKFAGPLRLVDDFETKRQSISASLEYACKYWVHHVKKSQCLLEDNGDVHDFLQVHLLHWFEATSILAISLNNIYLIKDLQSIVRNDGKAVKLLELLRDIERFIRLNQSLIAEAPLQVYMSALLFLPEKSVVKALFSPSCLDWVRKAPVTEEDWGLQLQTLEGHKGGVLSAVFSPDSKLLASVSSHDQTVKLWDTVSGWNIYTLEVPGVISAAFSPDGEQLASGSGRISIWNVASGELMQTMGEDYQHAVSSLAYSPDRRQLASGSTRGKIGVWDANSGVLLQSFVDHEHYVTCVTFSPNSKLLASASWDCTAKLWDVKAGTLLKTFRGHSGWVTSVIFSANGTSLATGSDDSTIKFWDMNSGAIIQTLHQPKNLDINSISLSPDGRGLISGTKRGGVGLWDLRTYPWTLMLEIYNHNDDTKSVAFSPDGTLFASSSWDRTTKLWDATKFWGKLDSDCKLRKEGSDRLSNIAQTHLRYVFPGQIVGLSPERRLVAVKSLDSTGVEVWDLISGTHIRTLNLQNRPEIVSWSSNRKLAVVFGDTRTVQIWDASSGKFIRTLGDRSVKSMAFSPNNQVLATGIYSSTVMLWDVGSGALLKAYQDVGTVESVAFSPDGTIIAALSLLGGLKLWSTLSEDLLYKLNYFGRNPATLAFSLDGKRLVGISDAAVELRDIDMASKRFKRSGGIYDLHGDESNPMKQNQTKFKISCTGFSPKEHRISFSSDGTTLRLDTGFIDMSLLGSDPNRVVFCPSQEHYYCDADGWLHWGVNPVKSLWFPAGYRPKELYKHGSLFVMLTDSSRLEHLEIDEDAFAKYF